MSSVLLPSIIVACFQPNFIICRKEFFLEDMACNFIVTIQYHLWDRHKVKNKSSGFYFPRWEIVKPEMVISVRWSQSPIKGFLRQYILCEMENEIEPLRLGKFLHIAQQQLHFVLRLKLKISFTEDCEDTHSKICCFFIKPFLTMTDTKYTK